MCVCVCKCVYLPTVVVVCCAYCVQLYTNTCTLFIITHLRHSGNGDGFFSSAFQSSLIGNELHELLVPECKSPCSLLDTIYVE